MSYTYLYKSPPPSGTSKVGGFKILTRPPPSRKGEAEDLRRWQLLMLALPTAAAAQSPGDGLTRLYKVEHVALDSASTLARSVSCGPGLRIATRFCRAFG